VLYETGAKISLLNDRLGLDLALFDLTREGIIAGDPDHAGFVIQSGKERSKGYSISFNTDPFPGLTLFGGYGYTDGKVLSSLSATSGTVGQQLRGLSKETFSVFAKYRFLKGTFKGLGLGAGYRWVSDFPGAYATTFVNPGYGVADAQINYGWGNHNVRYSFNVAIKNIFDEVYFSGPFSTVGNRAGDPRSYRASLKLSF